MQQGVLVAHWNKDFNRLAMLIQSRSLPHIRSTMVKRPRIFIRCADAVKPSATKPVPMKPTDADSTTHASADEGRYAKRGVSASKAEVHEAIKGMDKGLYPNAFCKILPDLAGGDPEWANCIHADTAGTKTSLAYLYWRETGDESVWAGIAQDALVMNLDDMACIGAVDRVLISSTIGRNKHRIPGSVIAALIKGTNAFLDRMRELGVDIHHGGGETADVGDIVRTVDVGFTAFARLPRTDILVNNIQPGDAIVALASYGQASYEQQYNGGMGSNGLTSARHDLFGADYAERFPESFDPQTDRSVVYTGPFRVTDPVPSDLPGAAAAKGLNMGQLVLSPTRTYLPFIAQALKHHRSALHGMIHCSGGAQTKVLHFAQGVRIIKDNMLPIPPLFHAIQSASGTAWEEMYRVFNMGHRLECYVDPSAAEDLIALAGEYNIDAQAIGRVEAMPMDSDAAQNGKTAEVLLESPFGRFAYQG